MTFGHPVPRTGFRGTPPTSIGGVRSRGSVLLLAVAAAASCDGAGPQPSGRTAADSVAVGPLAVQAEQPGATQRSWRVAESQRVGSLDGPLAFGRIVDIAPRAQGGMWVLDAQAKRVLGVSGTGRLELVFGGGGEGPGELEGPTGVFETGDGRIAVTESYPPRVQWYDASGRHLGTRYPADRGGPNGLPGPILGQWHVLADGTALVHTWSFPLPGGGTEARHALLRVPSGDSETSGSDTLMTWIVETDSPDPLAEVRLIAARPQWAARPDAGFWWTRGESYELRAFDRDGELERIVGLSRPPIALDAALQGRIQEFLLRGAARGPAGQAGMQSVIDRATWPDHLPSVARLWVSSPGGRLFVAPFGADQFADPPTIRLDVFEPDGRYAGRLDLPPGFSPKRFADGAVFGVLTDELGVELAVRFRLLEAETTS